LNISGDQTFDITQLFIYLFKSLGSVRFKAAVRSFLEVKNDPKYMFKKIHKQPVFKTLCSLIQDGKLVIMFLIQVVGGDL